MTLSQTAQTPPGRGPDRSPADARIRRRVADLFTPLDHDRPSRSATSDRRRDRELKRARAAASRAFSVKPSMSKRKAAALLLSTGAMALPAFKAPFDGNASGVSSSDTERSDRRIPATLLSASAEMRQALVEEEGMRRTVYRDIAGNPTVGVGHLVRPGDGLGVGDRITQAQTRAFLDADLRAAEKDAHDLLGSLPVYQHEFDALVDLIYNVGPGNVSSAKSPRLNDAIARGDYEAMAEELRYSNADGSYARGLDYRSERRTQIFLNASYEDPREAVRMT